MEIDLDGMRAQASLLIDQLDAAAQVPALRAIHMNVAPLLGELQGTVGRRKREIGTSQDIIEAEEILERIKAGSRRVGADIRLASPSALSLGLRTVLEDVLHLIAVLQRSLG